MWLKESNRQNAPYNGGQLQEVIIKPSTQSQKLQSISSRIFKDKQTRQRIYNTINTHLNRLDNLGVKSPSFNDTLVNTINLFNKSGRPSINNIDNLNTIGIKRDFYNPVTNSLNLHTKQGVGGKYYPKLIDELSHSFQYNNDIKHPKLTTSPIDGKKTYHESGSLEHQAHSTIAPKLRMYMTKGNDRLLDSAIKQANKEYDRHGNYWF